MNFITKIGKRFQSVYFKVKMFILGIQGCPAQTRKEIRLFKILLNNYIGKKHLNIFEWGSGLSSIYYAEDLRKKGADFEWHCIDNNRKWYERIKKRIDEKNLGSHIQIYLKEFPPFWEKPGWGQIPPECGLFGPKLENEKEYIKYPQLLQRKFDIIIIDARFRRHCMQIAREVILPDGIIILHDAQKEHYHTGLDMFDFRRFVDTGAWYPFQKPINKVWIGSVENCKIFELFKYL